MGPHRIQPCNIIFSVHCHPFDQAGVAGVLANPKPPLTVYVRPSGVALLPERFISDMLGTNVQILLTNPYPSIIKATNKRCVCKSTNYFNIFRIFGLVYMFYIEILRNVGKQPQGVFPLCSYTFFVCDLVWKLKNGIIFVLLMVCLLCV